MTNRREFFGLMAGAPLAVIVGGSPDSDSTNFTSKIARRFAFLLESFAGSRIRRAKIDLGSARLRDTVNIPIPYPVDRVGQGVAQIGWDNIQVVLDRHFESTIALPRTSTSEELDQYLLPGCLAMTEKFVEDAPRGAFLFAPLSDENGSVANCSGFIVRATNCGRGKDSIVSLDVLYGQIPSLAVVRASAKQPSATRDPSGGGVTDES